MWRAKPPASDLPYSEDVSGSGLGPGQVRPVRGSCPLQQRADHSAPLYPNQPSPSRQKSNTQFFEIPSPLSDQRRTFLRTRPAQDSTSLRPPSIALHPLLNSINRIHSHRSNGSRHRMFTPGTALLLAQCPLGHRTERFGLREAPWREAVG